MTNPLRALPFFIAVCVLASSPVTAQPVEQGPGGDRIELKNGTTIEGVYARDEGLWYSVWDSLDDVGQKPRRIPRSEVKQIKFRRGPAWDRKPNLPDLSIIFIEQNPKLPGLHGQMHYDKYGAVRIKGRKPDGAIKDTGEDGFTNPEESVEGLKFKREIGDRITLTGYVKNVGFRKAEPFSIVWEIDGREVKREQCDKRLDEQQTTTFEYKYTWAKDHPTVTFRIETAQEEIAKINNELTDPMWGFAYTFIVSKPRVAAWHKNRTAYGTFCFEDFYQWHVSGIMNSFFEHGVFPSTPDGTRGRVRLDRILYVDNPQKTAEELFHEDGLRYDQGGWVWTDSPEELESKHVEPPTHAWRNWTEWSLPHELGHQLGLIDWYTLDTKLEEGHPCSWPDNKSPAHHFQDYPQQMMHWHGPNLYGEVDAAVLDMTWDMPRGYYGDFVWAIPRECFLRVVDVNGDGIANAPIEIYQKNTEVKEGGKVDEDHGVKFYEVVEDGNFYSRPTSTKPVITGRTDWQGVMRLPNRPATPCRTLLGFERHDNPFGNMNVVGNRGVMFVKVTKPDGTRPTFYSIEIHDYNVAWFRGHKDKFMQVLRTPYGPVEGGPPAPAKVQAERMSDAKDVVKVTWEAPEQREIHYLDHIIAYKVYRRVSDDCLNDSPWFCVATLSPNVFEYEVDLNKQNVEELHWFGKTERFAVSAVGRRSVESGLTEVLLK